MINEAKHQFHKIGDYILELAVSTDGIGDAVVQTPFRTRTDTGVGTVNLGESVASGSAAALSFSIDSVQLQDYTPYSSELNQGYLATPKRWKNVG
jgi:hypothetical protein